MLGPARGTERGLLLKASKLPRTVPFCRLWWRSVRMVSSECPEVRMPCPLNKCGMSIYSVHCSHPWLWIRAWHAFTAMWCNHNAHPAQTRCTSWETYSSETWRPTRSLHPCFLFRSSLNSIPGDIHWILVQMIRLLDTPAVSVYAWAVLMMFCAWCFMLPRFRYSWRAIRGHHLATIRIPCKANRPVEYQRLLWSSDPILWQVCFVWLHQGSASWQAYCQWWSRRVDQPDGAVQTWVWHELHDEQVLFVLLTSTPTGHEDVMKMFSKQHLWFQKADSIDGYKHTYFVWCVLYVNVRVHRCTLTLFLVCECALQLAYLTSNWLVWQHLHLMP